MADPKPKLPKRTNWRGYTRKRCKNEGCKKRIRSYPELEICNKCVNKHNMKIDEANKSNRQKKREAFQK